MEEVSAFKKEIMGWQETVQKVGLSAFETLERRIFIKNKRLSGIVTTPAKPARLMGWWSPKTGRWMLFQRLATSIFYMPPPTSVELPINFEGEKLLYSTTEPNFASDMLIGNAEDLKWGVSCAKLTTGQEGLELPRRVACSENEKSESSELTLMGAIWTGSRIYAVFGNEGAPVIWKKVPSVAILKGVSRIKRKGLKGSKIATAGQERLEAQYLVALDTIRRARAIAIFKEKYSGKETIGTPYSLQTSYGFWTPKGGWRVIWEKVVADLENLNYQIFKAKPGVDMCSVTCGIMEEEQGYKLTLQNEYGKAVDLGTVFETRLDFEGLDLRPDYPRSKEEEKVSLTDQVLCVMAGGTPGERRASWWGKNQEYYALIGNKEGRPLGWERIFGLFELRKGEHFQKKGRVRNFQPVATTTGITELRKAFSAKNLEVF